MPSLRAPGAPRLKSNGAWTSGQPAPSFGSSTQRRMSGGAMNTVRNATARPSSAGTSRGVAAQLYADPQTSQAKIRPKSASGSRSTAPNASIKARAAHTATFSEPSGKENAETGAYKSLLPPALASEQRRQAKADSRLDARAAAGKRGFPNRPTAPDPSSSPGFEAFLHRIGGPATAAGPSETMLDASHSSHNSHHPRPGRTSMFAKSNHTASSGSSGTQDKRVGMSREVAHAHPASPEAGSIGSHSPGVPDHSPPQRSPLKSRLLSPTALVTSDAAVPEPPKPRSTFLERAEQAALKSETRIQESTSVELFAAQLLARAAEQLACSERSSNSNSSSDGSTAESSSTAWLLEACDGGVGLTAAMLPAAGVRKPRLTNELLARPPFRFVHDVVSELRNVSGFARGLFDDSTEVDARAMGKLQRIGYLDKLVALVDLQLRLNGQLTGFIKASKVVAGLECDRTNTLLQLLAVAAHAAPHSSASVVTVLGYIPPGLSPRYYAGPDDSAARGVAFAESVEARAAQASVEAEAFAKLEDAAAARAKDENEKRKRRAAAREAAVRRAAAEQARLDFEQRERAREAAEAAQAAKDKEEADAAASLRQLQEEEDDEARHLAVAAREAAAEETARLEAAAATQQALRRHQKQKKKQKEQALEAEDKVHSLQQRPPSEGASAHADEVGPRDENESRLKARLRAELASAAAAAQADNASPEKPISLSPVRNVGKMRERGGGEDSLGKGRTTTTEASRAAQHEAAVNATLAKAAAARETETRLELEAVEEAERQAATLRQRVVNEYVAQREASERAEAAAAADAEAARVKALEEEAAAEAARVKAIEEETAAEEARVKAIEEAAAEAARVKALEEEAARVKAIEEEAAIEAARVKAIDEEAAAEAARVKAIEEEAEAARVKAIEEEATVEAARVKAIEEEAAEAARVKALEEEAAAEAARVKALEEEAAAEAARVKAIEEEAAAGAARVKAVDDASATPGSAGGTPASSEVADSSGSGRKRLSGVKDALSGVLLEAEVARLEALKESQALAAERRSLEAERAAVMEARAHDAARVEAQMQKLAEEHAARESTGANLSEEAAQQQQQQQQQQQKEHVSRTVAEEEEEEAFLGYNEAELEHELKLRVESAKKMARQQARLQVGMVGTSAEEMDWARSQALTSVGSGSINDDVGHTELHDSDRHHQDRPAVPKLNLPPQQSNQLPDGSEALSPIYKLPSNPVVEDSGYSLATDADASDMVDASNLYEGNNDGTNHDHRSEVDFATTMRFQGTARELTPFEKVENPEQSEKNEGADSAVVHEQPARTLNFDHAVAAPPMQGGDDGNVSEQPPTARTAEETARDGDNAGEEEGRVFTAAAANAEWDEYGDQFGDGYGYTGNGDAAVDSTWAQEEEEVGNDANPREEEEEEINDAAVWQPYPHEEGESGEGADGAAGAFDAPMTPGIGLEVPLGFAQVATPHSPSALAPDLYTYMVALFEAFEPHDGEGYLGWDDFWWCVASLGLGLSDDDIHTLQADVDGDADGWVSWRDFVPVIAKLLRNSFAQRDWVYDQENPWIQLHDSESGADYYYNRETGQSEWVTSTPRQEERLTATSPAPIAKATPTTHERRAARREKQQQQEQQQNGDASSHRSDEKLVTEKAAGAVQSPDAASTPASRSSSSSSSSFSNSSSSSGSSSASSAASVAIVTSPQLHSHQHLHRVQDKEVQQKREILREQLPYEATTDAVPSPSFVQNDTAAEEPLLSVDHKRISTTEVPSREAPVEPYNDASGTNPWVEWESRSVEWEHQQHRQQQQQQSEGGREWAGASSGANQTIAADVSAWVEHWDEASQASYWVHAHTGDSKWEPPSITATSTVVQPTSSSVAGHDMPSSSSSSSRAAAAASGNAAGSSLTPARTSPMPLTGSAAPSSTHTMSPKGRGRLEARETSQNQHLENISNSSGGGGGDAQGWVVVADAASSSSSNAPSEYYLHTSSGESAWEMPPPLVSLGASALAAVRWTRCFDDHNGTDYWVHDASGHSQWHPPGTLASVAALAASASAASAAEYPVGSAMAPANHPDENTDHLVGMGLSSTVADATGDGGGEWEQHWDEATNSVYWLNAHTGVSQWEDPYASSHLVGWSLNHTGGHGVDTATLTDTSATNVGLYGTTSTNHHYSEQPVPLGSEAVSTGAAGTPYSNAPISEASRGQRNHQGDEAPKPLLRPRSASISAHLASTLDYGNDGGLDYGNDNYGGSGSYDAGSYASNNTGNNNSAIPRNGSSSALQGNATAPRPVSAMRVPRPTPRPVPSPSHSSSSNQPRRRPGSAPAARSSNNYENGYGLSYEATG